MIESVKLVLDVDSGISRLGGNKQLYIHLLKKFNEILKKDLPLYEKAQSEKSMLDLHGEIHTLKGVSGNLSALALYEVSTSLDSSLKAGLLDQELNLKVVRILRETQQEVEIYLQENSQL